MAFSLELNRFLNSFLYVGNHRSYATSENNQKERNDIRIDWYWQKKAKNNNKKTTHHESCRISMLNCGHHIEVILLDPPFIKS